MKRTIALLALLIFTLSGCEATIALAPPMGVSVTVIPLPPSAWSATADHRQLLPTKICSKTPVVDTTFGLSPSKTASTPIGSPPPPIPPLAAILKTPMGKLALNADGSPKPAWFTPKATWYSKDGKAHVVTVPTQSPKLAAALNVTTITPGEPLDLGASTDVSGNPLFSLAQAESGDQGQLPNCWVLAQLMAWHDFAPWFIYAIENHSRVVFYPSSGKELIVQQDGLISAAFDYPEPSDGACANCLYTKALAGSGLMGTKNQYANIGEGYPGTILTFEGCTWTAVAAGTPTTPTVVLGALAAGRTATVCTFGTIPNGNPLIPAHCYAIRNAYTVNGQQLWDLVNPWYGNVVTITNAQFVAGVSSVCIQTSFPFAPPTYLPGDANRDGVVDVNDSAILSAHWQLPVPAGTDPWSWGCFFPGETAVNINDLAAMSENWQKTTTQPAEGK